jgi:hypothetical protein
LLLRFVRVAKDSARRCIIIIIIIIIPSSHSINAIDPKKLEGA